VTESSVFYDEPKRTISGREGSALGSFWISVKLVLTVKLHDLGMSFPARQVVTGGRSDDHSLEELEEGSFGEDDLVAGGAISMSLSGHPWAKAHLSQCIIPAPSQSYGPRFKHVTHR
jgi:hypothetical protein